MQNSNGSFGAKETPQEWRKIFCAYHATEFLTNFCIEKDCLMPLCPSCVVEHTEEHYQCQQKPTYVNLNEALHNSRQVCYSHIMKLEEFARKNVELENYIHGLPDYLHRQLADCKDRILSHIDLIFEAHEKRLLADIQAQYAAKHVYNQEECAEVREYISSQTEALQEKIFQLKGDHCLAALIRYYEEDAQTFEAEAIEVGAFVDRNKQAGGLYVDLNIQKLGKLLEGLCEKTIEVQYVQEPPQETQQRGLIKKNFMMTSVVNRIPSLSGGSLRKHESGSKQSGKKKSEGPDYSKRGDGYHSPF